MLLISPTAAALIGALLVLTSIDSFACGYRHTASEHDLEGPMNEESHVLMVGNGGTAESVYSHRMDQFDRRAKLSAGGYRRMQQAISVDVNFVVVKHTDGRGVTEEQMRAQMEVLNNAFSPDFVFKLNNSQVVTNNTWFDLRGDEDVELQMMRAQKRGGVETMNVYAVHPIHSDGSRGGGWARYPWIDAGSLDGVVISFDSVPGADSTENSGTVSRKGTR
jgi:hypothetical protein